jgi:hypothetical protein
MLNQSVSQNTRSYKNYREILKHLISRWPLLRINFLVLYLVSLRLSRSDYRLRFLFRKYDLVVSLSWVLKPLLPSSNIQQITGTWLETCVINFLHWNKCHTEQRSLGLNLFASSNNLICNKRRKSSFEIHACNNYLICTNSLNPLLIQRGEIT